ncbi:hypothetical protein EBX93_18270 [bacterium]|nr:hypothetical protein [bacterium]
MISTPFSPGFSESCFTVTDPSVQSLSSLFLFSIWSTQASIDLADKWMGLGVLGFFLILSLLLASIFIPIFGITEMGGVVWLVVV